MTYETQPEALRLADECEESAKLWAHEIDTRKRAAAELRRLHVQAAQDEALLRQALDVLFWTTGSEDFSEGGLAREGALKALFPTIAALRERLESDDVR